MSDLSEIVVLVGLPGAGKSTYYERYFKETHMLISKDLMSGSGREAKQRFQLQQALSNNLNVVVDNTNVSIEARSGILEIAKGVAIVKAYYFTAGISDCIRRNNERKRVVPEQAIRIFSNKFQVPTVSEGFDAVYHVITVEADNSFGITEAYEATN